MDPLESSLQTGAKPTAPYSSRPPSPPHIHVPPYGRTICHTRSHNGHRVVTNAAKPHNTTTTTNNNNNNDVKDSHSDRDNTNDKDNNNKDGKDGGGGDDDDPQIMTIQPSPAAVHALGLSPADFGVITAGGAPQSARVQSAGSSDWVYSARRVAQRVLDFLWLGPARVVRDAGFLQREGITLVLCARDARFVGGAFGSAAASASTSASTSASGGGGAASSGAQGGCGSGPGAGKGTGSEPGSGSEAARAPKQAANPLREGLMVTGVRRAILGSAATSASDVTDAVARPVEVDVVDVGEGAAMIGSFVEAARCINAHVLRAWRETDGRRRGTVLVVCETGNDRSAALVAAYLMAMYGLDTVQTVQFLQMQRFCITLSDTAKHSLQSYGDLLRARADVGAAATTTASGSAKRRIGETLEGQGEHADADAMALDEMDGERYDRRDFAPFVDEDA